jgi:molybdopterin-guanine dinucleotide biosynthesis protein A
MATTESTATHLGIVLAGGKSSRMGSNKALLPLGNSTLLGRTLATMSQLCPELVISGEPSIYAQYEQRIIADTYQGIGPLGGLYSCMQAAQADWYWVATCDQPFLMPFVYQRLHGAIRPSTQVVYATTHNQTHPLVAIFHRSVFAKLTESIANEKYGVWKLIQQTNFTEVPFARNEQHAFLNMNTTDDYKLISSMNTHNVTLLYFGIVADIIGNFSENIAWNGTLGDLNQMLLQKHPQLANQQLRYAINRNLATMDQTIAPGDEIALLPPFSGG